MPEKTIEQALTEKKISEVGNPKRVKAPPDTPIAQAVKIMQESKSGYIVVAKQRKVVGLFTETDFIQKILEKGVDWSKPIKDFMNHEPPILAMSDSVGRAIDLMGKNRIYYIPLVNERKELVNVISVRTLIRFLAAFSPAEVYNLPPRANQISLTAEGG